MGYEKEIPMHSGLINAVYSYWIIQCINKMYLFSKKCIEYYKEIGRYGRSCNNKKPYIAA
ncbi:MAG: hypothetical protein WA421_09235 [Nitrososphaeraceae archaeon]|jgi:hypothetical protein